MPRVQKVAIVPVPIAPQKFELPSDEVMQKLNLSTIDFADFAVCLQVISNQTSGMSLGNACRAAGLPVRTLYEPRWEELMAKARRVATGVLLTGVANAATQVFDKWPEVVNSVINVAINGGRDHEKVMAAQLLHEIFIGPISEKPADDTREREYMLKPKNFNTQFPVQVNEGGTVIINNTGIPLEPKLIDVEAE